jgi:hypothetical protein
MADKVVESHISEPSGAEVKRRERWQKTEERNVISR